MKLCLQGKLERLTLQTSMVSARAKRDFANVTLLWVRNSEHFLRVLFSFFFPPPHRPLSLLNPPPSRTSKLLHFREEMHYSGAGVRRGLGGGHPTEKRRNFLKKWRTKIGQNCQNIKIKLARGLILSVAGFENRQRMANLRVGHLRCEGIAERNRGNYRSGFYRCWECKKPYTALLQCRTSQRTLPY